MPQVEPFDGYEIHPVAEDEGGCCEPVDTIEKARQQGVKAFWSLYGHLPEGGVECIADRDEWDLIAELYTRITGNVAEFGDCLLPA